MLGLSQKKAVLMYKVKETVAYWRSKRHLWEVSPSKKSMNKGAKVEVPGFQLKRRSSS
jgi:hypothetical protein